MIAVVPGGERWRLIGRTGRGADVLASGRQTDDAAGDGPRWQNAMERLRDADGDLRVAAPDDRHYRWVLLDENGSPIAACPPVHRDPAQCRGAFNTARRAADAALADHHHPMADLRQPAGHDHPMADATTG